MPNNFFITGMPRSGKTTLLRDLAQELRKHGISVGGFISPEKKEHGTREGFFIEDIETGEMAMLASLEGAGPKVSKYHVDVAAFEQIALRSMRNADKYDILILDEIGVMEMKSTAFQDALTDLLESEKPLVATLHRDYVNMYEIFGRVYALAETNRGEVYASVLRNVLRSFEEKKIKKPEKKIPAAKKAEGKTGIKKEAKKPEREEVKKEKKAGKPKKKTEAKKQTKKPAEKMPEKKPIAKKQAEKETKKEERTEEKTETKKPTAEIKHEEKKGFFSGIKKLFGI